MSGMLVQFLLLLLVVVIAVLMAVDVVRSRGESLHGYVDGQAHGTTYPVTGVRRADRGEAFLRPPAATGISDAGSAGHAASISPSAGNDPRSHVGSVGDPGLHGELNTVFVNLSHRSQSLVERQIRLLQILEQGEKDPERQAILLRLDGIANRMHRNSENLLILAGQERSSNWNQPVAVANVIRVAVSEVEESQRVSLNAHPDIAIVGSAVNNVVHLLAELIENATSFSAADMRVDISGRLLTSGGALLDITDQGIGMTPKELAYANWRLENPPTAEVNVPKWIGMFVVARLAARHGVGVRLQPAEVGGLTALVWLPNEVLTQQGAAAAPRFSDFGTAERTRGLHEVEPEPGDVTVGRRATAAKFAPPAENVGHTQLDRRSVADPGQRSDASWSPSARSAWRAGPAADPASSDPELHDAMGEHAGAPSGKPARNSGGEPTGDIAGGNVGARLGSTGTGGSDISPVATALPGTAAPVRQETSPADGVIVPSAEGLTQSAGCPSSMRSRRAGSGTAGARPPRPAPARRPGANGHHRWTRAGVPRRQQTRLARTARRQPGSRSGRRTPILFLVPSRARKPRCRIGQLLRSVSGSPDSSEVSAKAGPLPSKR